jgi:Ca2+-transporting ATPase
MSNRSEDHSYHSVKINDVFKKFDTSKEGLSFKEANKRLKEHGPNEIEKGEKVNPLKILLSQFKDALIIILLAAAIISAVLKEEIDAIVISAIVIASVILGFTQEYRAERAAEALQKMVSPTATVIRESEEQEVDAKKIVPGDILKIAAGDKIAADVRLFQTNNLQIDESALTGESTSVDKDVEIIDQNTNLADRINMAYSGTIVTYGNGLGVVVATGMESEFGKIASMLQEVEEEQTPLQKRMREIGRLLIAVSVFVVSIVTGLGIVRGHELFEMFLWGVSLAVAAVPEALPAVVTGSLAIGMRKMAERNAIVKELPAVETLGSTTVICSDKTGTLTKGEMTVKKIFYQNEIFNVEGSGYSPKGNIENVDLIKKSNVAKISILCNDSQLMEENGEYKIKGQPTEAALLVMASKICESIEETKKKYPRISDIPFSSKRKMMTTIHKLGDNSKFAAVKGAPEVILKKCNRTEADGNEKRLDEDMRKHILKTNNELAKDALRVIALAYKNMPPDKEEFTEEDEKDLIYVALAGMIDPPRDEVKRSIDRCKKAGMRVIMVTGDNKLTALAIAKNLEITDNDEALDGSGISKINDDEFKKKLKYVNVFARVSPEHKMRIVRILKDDGEIVAVTGDGVNDAPALKNSDIGIAMGITGTEVTKEASDMVLMDDNFSTIVSAIERGRGTFDNVKKYLSFLLSSNTGEIIVMFVAGLIGLPLPLIALQILWVNLVTDGFPAMALGVDPPEPDVMQRPPRSPKASVFDTGVKTIIFIIGVIMAISCLTVFYWYLKKSPDEIVKAQTMVFTIMVMFELFNAFNCRSTRYSLTKINPFQNKYLIIAVTLSIILQVVVIYTPALSIIFNTVALTMGDWLIVLIACLPAIIGVEIGKSIVKHKDDYHNIWVLSK